MILPGQPTLNFAQGQGLLSEVRGHEMRTRMFLRISQYRYWLVNFS